MTLSSMTLSSLTFSEYEDGRVVWSIVDALRTDDADTDLYDYHRWSTQSRGTSLHSSRRESEPDTETESSIPDVSRWAGAQGLNLRRRETMAQRPETNVSAAGWRALTPQVFFTSSADVADLIDHLSRDLGTSKGRIDILPSSPRAELFAVSVFRRSKRRGLRLHRVGIQRARGAWRGSVRRRAVAPKGSSTSDQPEQTRGRARSGVQPETTNVCATAVPRRAEQYQSQRGELCELGECWEDSGGEAAGVAGPVERFRGAAGVEGFARVGGSGSVRSLDSTLAWPWRVDRVVRLFDTG
jgi:hypothetical protein